MHVRLEEEGEDGEDADGADAGGRTPWAEGSADAATFSPHSTAIPSLFMKAQGQDPLLVHQSENNKKLTVQNF